tara:strand:+ start:281 stop:706 length:426 start_codon:yes stop_codon:yes gene_type:complete
MSKTRTRWTSEELKTLESFAGKLSLEAISIAMGRSESSLRAKAYKRKIPLQYTNLTWTNDRLEKLEKFRQEGKTWENISKELGCSEASCQRASSRYRISLRKEKENKFITEVDELLSHCVKSSTFTKEHKDFIVQALKDCF